MQWVFKFITDSDTPIYCIGYYAPNGDYVCAGAHVESLLDAVRLVCLLNGGQWESRLNMEMIEAQMQIIEAREGENNGEEQRTIPLRIVRNERAGGEGDDTTKR